MSLCTNPESNPLTIPSRPAQQSQGNATVVLTESDEVDIQVIILARRLQVYWHNIVSLPKPESEHEDFTAQIEELTSNVDAVKIHDPKSDKDSADEST